MPAALRSPVEDADLPCVLFRRSRGLLDRLQSQREAESRLESHLRISFSDVGGSAYISSGHGNGQSADRAALAPAVVSVSLEACADAEALLAVFDELSWRARTRKPGNPRHYMRWDAWDGVLFV